MSANIGRGPDDVVAVFLCGDVMTGRGIDQIMGEPCEPTLNEPHIKDARDYWRLAKKAHGAIPRPVDVEYIWGDALGVWDHMKPDLRIVNLETAITTSDAAWPRKGIHYRMSPKNVGCLAAARIDCCALANNHVLDWGHVGLTETLHALRSVGIKTCGAGENRAEAQAPAVTLSREGQRVLVFSFGIETSGIPFTWAADGDRAGVNWLPDVSEPSIEQAAEIVNEHSKENDIVIASIHWGGNWGHEIQPGDRYFARQLIETAGVDMLHGHSSHHAKGIEVHRDRLILYGCGDFLTDYEGISGYERFRGDLSLMYFADLQPTSGRLIRLRIVPLQMHRLQLRSASQEDVIWLSKMLTREGKPFGTRAHSIADNALAIEWSCAR
jgi:poly-gamma-glutamate capsule biosynthesis protein CapA/YwtB (metallophosphatase superfamily)